MRWGYHIDAAVEHLTAMTNGEITRLLINIPPGHMKSLLCCVFHPAWEWIKKPWMRSVFSSYSPDLSNRDAVKMRNIIQSRWYQERWGDIFRIVDDQNEKRRYNTDKTGFRVATSVMGLGAGEGGHRLVVDDPHNTIQAESIVVRANVVRWFFETFATRLRDPEKGQKLVIMQRQAQNDLAGTILEKELGYVHLCLPARYEVDRKILLTQTPLDTPDPRTKEGEVLWPELYNEKAQTMLEKEMTDFAIAGQLQQRPSPRGGGQFKIDRIHLIKSIPKNMILESVRYWDKAGTEDGGKFTAGVLIHRLSKGLPYEFLITDCVRGQWGAFNREKYIKNTCELDAVEYGDLSIAYWVEQEPGSGGKESAENTVNNLAGFRIKTDKVTGEKEVRAEPLENQVENSNVAVLLGSWTKLFLEEGENWPVGKFLDQWDAASGAFNKLTAKGKRAGVF